MAVEIDEDNLKKGLLGLLVTLIEVIQEVLEGQALKRMEGGSLTEEEVERLGSALMDLNDAIESLKKEHNLEDAVRDLRESLDGIAEEALEGMINPESWPKRIEGT